FDRTDGSVVDATDLDVFGHRFDAGQGVVGALGGRRSNHHLAVVVDVDLRLRRFLQLADRLAPRSDQQADLLLVDLRDPDLRSGFGEGLPGTADRRQHHPQQFPPRLTCLFQRLANDFFADAGNLEVELDAGDAPLRSGDLEIHVAEVIFVTHDVRQQDVP